MVDLVSARLRAQRLLGTRFDSAVDAVRWFGAVQSQDYPAAKWALGLRLKSSTEAQIDRAYDEGAILRTHVLRPTWHFVTPEDIRWMLALTAPKIRRGVSSRFQRLGLDDRTVKRAHTVFETALAGGIRMTRQELGAELKRRGIAPDGQRLPHLLFSAELAGLLTSGARKGKQLAFALLEERVPRSRSLDRDEAIGELTRRYFVSHGPAQLRDFVWWSGLTQFEAKRGIAIAGEALASREVDRVTYWCDPRHAWTRPAARTAHLLPNFDEYSVAYADRSAMLHPARPFRPELFAFSSILSNIVTIDGQVSGAWRRISATDRLIVVIRLLADVTAPERKLVEDAARRFSRFLGRRVDLTWA